MERQTVKEDRDYILDYKSVNTKNLSVSNILGVEVNNVTRDEALAIILEHIEKGQGILQVIFLDPLKLLRLRPGKKLAGFIHENRLLLADGAGLEWAAAKLGAPLKERIPMINVLMDVVRLAEIKEKSIYFFGSRTDRLEKVFFNLKRSFPAVRIIGRQSGYFDQNRESLIKEAIRKSSPDILFLGIGFPNQEKWLSENSSCCPNAVVFGVDGAFDILSGKEKKAPDWFQLRGLTWFWRVFSRPWRINRIFRAFSFFMLTTLKRIFSGKKSKSSESES